MFKAKPSAASPYAPFEEEKKEEGEHAIDADEMDKLFAAMNQKAQPLKTSDETKTALASAKVENNEEEKELYVWDGAVRLSYVNGGLK